MVSKIYEILHDTNPEHDDAYKLNALNSEFETLMDFIFAMRKVLVEENETLDELMDANGDNPEEHHAKTMVFYGRKLSVRDVLTGVKSADASYQEPPNVGLFTGLNYMLSNYDVGSVPVTWDCMHYKSVDQEGTVIQGDMSDLYKANNAPNTGSLTQHHNLGSVVEMPTILNLDNNGTGAGTNTYKLKSGYIINGWVVDGIQYMYAPDGNFYKYQTKGGHPEPIPDQRVFGFGATSAYQLPFNIAIAPRNATTSAIELKFNLDVSFMWFTITFVVRFGEAQSSAPCMIPIKTMIGKEIQLPSTNLINMYPGWQIYKDDTYKGGCWTTTNPSDPENEAVLATDPLSMAVKPLDPDGDEMPIAFYAASDRVIVGGDGLDAGVRYLYLVPKKLGGGGNAEPVTPDEPEPEP